MVDKFNLDKTIDPYASIDIDKRGLNVLDESMGQEMFDQIVDNRKQPYEEYVDIYDFFDKFYELISDLNLLNTDSQELDKITLVEEYPNQEYEEKEFVVYSIGKRDFYASSTHSNRNSTRQVRPLQLEGRYDIIENNIIKDFAYKFDNEIELAVFSTSLKRLQEICRLLEAIIFKYKGKLKLYVADILYKGQTEVEYNSKHFERRLFKKSIKLQVITCETYSKVSEEIKYTNIKY